VIHRNLNLQTVIGRRQHQRLAFQLDCLAAFLDRLGLPEDRVIATEVAADRTSPGYWYAEQPRLGTCDLLRLLAVAGRRAAFEGPGRTVAFDLALVGAVGRLLVRLFALKLARRAERRLWHVPFKRPRADEVIHVRRRHRIARLGRPGRLLRRLLEQRLEQ